MALILNIETSTPICSVALSKDGQLLTEKTDNQGQNHAKLLTLLIEKLFEESDYKLSQLDAVAISHGPGSYTGLRIGTSVAKGLCYALNIPPLTINTLQAMANCPSIDSPTALRCPMIDARRMEVYCQLFDSTLIPQNEVEAKVLDEYSFTDILEKREIIFMGDGCKKFQQICQSSNAIFRADILPSASQMIYLAEKAFEQKDFADVAYFSPFYLKNFQVTTSKKRVF